MAIDETNSDVNRAVIDFTAYHHHHHHHHHNNNKSASFKFKQKITDQTGNDGTRHVKIMVPLKYLSNFWRTLEM